MRWLRMLAVVGALALLGSGCDLYGWGGPYIGDGTANPHLTPSASGAGHEWIQVDAGAFHACGIDSSHALWCWGDNTVGQLGIGSEGAPQTAPLRVGTANDWTEVSAGGFGGSYPFGESLWGFTCGIRAGSLYCWGATSLIPTYVSVPTRIGTATDWSSVSAGGLHVCGLRTNGALYCAGDNRNGELGDGTSTNRMTPVQGARRRTGPRQRLDGCTTCGLQGGSLFCWGDNTNGEIGDGTTTTRLVPTRVGTASDWSAVSTGGAGEETGSDQDVREGYTCAIRAGELSCWGNNAFGQVGDGTNVTRLVPTRIGVATDWQAISLGACHSCGIQSSLKAFCWGANYTGQIGDGTQTNRSTPTQLPVAWAAVSTGRSLTLGLR